MKKFYILIALAFLLTGSAIADNLVHPKGKHKSHKKAKKKKSGYYFNFQH
jgi:hypothetical protein